jgi:hypothetical protein
MLPNPDGVCDKDVPVLALRGEDDALVGLCYSYCCHPTILLGPQISGDYPGQTSLALEEEHGGVALFLPGTFGNVRPHLVNEEGGFRKCDPSDAADCAQQLQVGVNQGLRNAQIVAGDAISACRVQHELPLAPLPTVEEIDTILTSQWKEPADAVANHQHQGLRRWAQTVEAARAQPPASMSFCFSALSIGSVQLVGMSGEFFLEYGMQAQALFGDHTIALGYTQGCQSYVPTDQALVEGGYETVAWRRFGQLAPFAQGVEAAVEAGLRRLLPGSNEKED